jgi:hypothetical protein
MSTKRRNKAFVLFLVVISEGNPLLFCLRARLQPCRSQPNDKEGLQPLRYAFGRAATTRDPIQQMAFRSLSRRKRSPRRAVWRLGPSHPAGQPPYGPVKCPRSCGLCNDRRLSFPWSIGHGNACHPACRAGPSGPRMAMVRAPIFRCNPYLRWRNAAVSGRCHLHCVRIAGHARNCDDWRCHSRSITAQKLSSIAQQNPLSRHYPYRYCVHRTLAHLS